MGDRHLDRWFRKYRDRGDVEALGRLFDAAALELGRIAAHLCRDTCEAEDVLQATFLTAMERAASWDPTRRFLPWATGILANHARAARRRRVHAPPPEDEPGSPEPGPSSRAADREFRSAVGAAVDELPESYRDVVARHLDAGERPVDLARELGLSEGAVRVRLHRGLKLLSRRLPAGFATAVAVSTLSPASLAAVRRTVMTQAGSLAPAATAGVGGGALLLGGLVVSQRSILIAVTLVVLAGGGLLWRELGAASRDPGTRGTSARAELTLPPEPGPVVVGDPAPSVESNGAMRELAEPEAAPPRSSPGTRFSGLALDVYGGGPVAGAEVRAPTEPGGPLELVAVVDERGRFDFESFPDADLELRIEAPGYAPIRVPRSVERRARFHVESGREVLADDRVNVGAISMYPGVALAGRVVDATGAPVAGAEVLHFWQPWNSEPEPVDELPVGRSDATGEVRFEGLLRARKIQADGNHLLFAVAATGSGWVRIAADPDRRVLDRFEIRITEPRRLAVQVLDTEGEPVVDAVVRCVPHFAPFPNIDRWDEISLFRPVPAALAPRLETRSDAAGFAELPRLPGPAGDEDDRARFDSVRVDVFAPGFVPYSERSTFRPGDPSLELDVRLAHTREVRIAGRVIDAEGEPISGARARIEDREPEASSDGRGRFELPVPDDGATEVTLAVDAVGFPPARVDLELDADVALDELEVVLLPAAPVHGIVVDEAGVPVEGVHIGIWNRPGPMTSANERTGPDGGFTIDDATAGEWNVSVVPPFGSETEFDRPRGLTLRGGDANVRIVLPRARPRTRVALQVVDATSGATLDPQQVKLIRRVFVPNLAMRMPSREGGRVTWPQVPAGPWTVWAAVDGYALGWASFDLEEGQAEHDVTLELVAAGGLDGSVDFTGVAYPERARVHGKLTLDTDRLPGGDGWSSFPAVELREELGSAGAFSSSALTPGTWELTLEAPGLAAEATRVEVRPGERAHVELRAIPAAVLELVGELPVDDAWIVVSTSADGASWGTQHLRPADEAPPLPLGLTVPPGTVHWRASFVDAGFEPVAREQRGTAELGPGETLRVEVAVEPL